MIEVLMVMGTVPGRVAVLTDALQQFRDRGVTVRVATTFDPVEKIPAATELAEVHLLPTATELGPRFGRAVKRAAPARRPWLRAQRDPWVRRHAKRADVLVALDAQALHTVWQLAQRYRRADAVYGIAPALRAVEKRSADPARYRRPRLNTVGPAPTVLASATRNQTVDLAKRVFEMSTGKRAMKLGPVRWFWQGAVTAPGLPERHRGKIARRVTGNMLKTGHGASAKRLALAAQGRLKSPATKGQLLGPIVDAELSQGKVPEHLMTVVRGQLKLADGFLKKRNPGKAAPHVLRAFNLMFHRIVQFDGTTSPLAEDPEKFLAPLHNSEAGRAMATPRGRQSPAEFPPAGRPHRMLFFTGLNDNFLGPILERYEAMPGVEVRRLNLMEESILPVLSNGRTNVTLHMLAGASKRAGEVQEAWGPHLEWADTVFVDWCNLGAAMLTMIDPGTTRVIVRLHSFEAFSWWPHLTDWSRVDDVVFVSEHLRDLALAAVPRLRAPQGPRTHMISNAMDLHRYVAPKVSADSRFTLGLVGLSSLAKDPRWALAVLRELRRHDERYRLKLVGDDLNPELSPAITAYVRELDAELAELEPSGAVVRTGRTEDVPGALTDVGVILSTSLRESFHCALVEGAASGAVPVVRDWPFFAGRPHSARSLFPSDWVVGTPQEAAERILALTATEEIWREAGRAAASHVLSTWDWSVTQKDFDRLLLEPPATSG
ncbi:glycosyltransferase family 1 protein [Micromonospora aurantiaca]|uniref:glycosyltransferase family 1 protein n=1 Tax=Micromonospora aurantiaca (nom. illeg.) TaxID=47850 RepID=UPI0033DFFBE4